MNITAASLRHWYRKHSLDKAICNFLSALLSWRMWYRKLTLTCSACNQKKLKVFCRKHRGYRTKILSELQKSQTERTHILHRSAQRPRCSAAPLSDEEVWTGGEIQALFAAAAAEQSLALLP